DATRGAQVSIPAKNLVPSSVYTVRINSGATGPDAATVLPATVSADKQTLTFAIPDKTPTGRYLVWVGVDGKSYPVPGELRVIPDAQAAVSIDTIYPSVVYPAGPNGVSFEISGKNLGDAAANNLLFVNRRLVLTKAASCDTTSRADAPNHTPCLVVDAGT